MKKKLEKNWKKIKVSFNPCFPYEILKVSKNSYRLMCPINVVGREDK